MQQNDCGWFVYWQNSNFNLTFIFRFYYHTLNNHKYQIKRYSFCVCENIAGGCLGVCGSGINSRIRGPLPPLNIEQDRVSFITLVHSLHSCCAVRIVYSFHLCGSCCKLLCMALPLLLPTQYLLGFYKYFNLVWLRLRILGTLGTG